MLDTSISNNNKNDDTTGTTTTSIIKCTTNNINKNYEEDSNHRSTIICDNNNVDSVILVSEGSSFSDISCVVNGIVPAFKAQRRVRADSYHSWQNVRDQVKYIFLQEAVAASTHSNNADGRMYYNVPNHVLTQPSISVHNFKKITKELCGFPSFFNGPLYRRILCLYGNNREDDGQVTLNMLERFWEEEIDPYDASDRLFRLIKQPSADFIIRDDFPPFIDDLLDYHPGLQFLRNHSEIQEKYAVTVITRIFYCVNTCHNGKITARQLRKSDLLEALHAVDKEDDINKIAHYFSYENFYVLYCRFWELDHDRDSRITRDDLLRYGDHSLSHLIVDRIFEAADRPFGLLSNANATSPPNCNINTNSNQELNADTTTGARDYLSYEDFIFFMLSEEDKANETSVRYWFHCIDVDGDQKLNIMEMRFFYAVQLDRMQCLGHEIVLFEDMLCQMMDIIKPSNTQYFVVEDFLKSECAQVSGSLFDALFNLTKFLQFEQKDPFLERRKRKDAFECDWDRFACIDYYRLALEEEVREEEAMEIDWVTVDKEDDDVDDINGLSTLAPF